MGATTSALPAAHPPPWGTTPERKWERVTATRGRVGAPGECYTWLLGSSKLEEQKRGSGGARVSSRNGWARKVNRSVLDQGEGSPDQSRPETAWCWVVRTRVLGLCRLRQVLTPLHSPRGPLVADCTSSCLGLLACEGRVIMIQLAMRR